MNINLKRKYIFFTTTIILFTLISISFVKSNDHYGNFYLNTHTKTKFTNYFDINVNEAWNLLNDTSNGIQIPIDVRTNNEWKSEHILTPKPENPKQFIINTFRIFSM